jgi:hypothetical protein
MRCSRLTPVIEWSAIEWECVPAARTPYGTEGTVEGAERAVKYDEKKTPQFTHHSAAGPSDRSDLSLEAVSKRVSNVQVAEGERHSR